MSNMVATAPQFLYSVVNVADNSTTVFDSPCLLAGIYVNTTLSAHALPIQDNTTAVFTLPASTAAGTWIPFADAFFQTSLVIDPNDAATGSVTVVYAPVDVA